MTTGGVVGGSGSGPMEKGPESPKKEKPKSDAAKKAEEVIAKETEQPKSAAKKQKISFTDMPEELLSGIAKFADIKGMKALRESSKTTQKTIAINNESVNTALKKAAYKVAKIPDDWKEALQMEIENVTRLDFSTDKESIGIPIGDIEALGRMLPHIQVLNLEKVVTTKPFWSVPNVQDNFPKINTLVLPKKMTNEMLALFAEQHLKIKTLILPVAETRDSFHLETVVALFDSCEHLEHVEFSGSSADTFLEGLSHSKQLGKIKSITLKDCLLSTGIIELAQALKRSHTKLELNVQGRGVLRESDLEALAEMQTLPHLKLDIEHHLIEVWKNLVKQREARKSSQTGPQGSSAI